MAFNNFFPATYNPIGYTPTYQPPTTPTQSGIVWVQGEAGAKAHPVGAGQSALLMDSENNVFYIKSTDVSGMPRPLRVFDYKERAAEIAQNAPQQAIDTSLFVTRDELEKRIAELVGEKNALIKKGSED